MDEYPKDTSGLLLRLKWPCRHASAGQRTRRTVLTLVFGDFSNLPASVMLVETLTSSCPIWPSCLCYCLASIGLLQKGPQLWDLQQHNPACVLLQVCSCECLIQPRSRMWPNNEAVSFTQHSAHLNSSVRFLWFTSSHPWHTLAKTSSDTPVLDVKRLVIQANVFRMLAVSNPLTPPTHNRISA